MEKEELKKIGEKWIKSLKRWEDDFDKFNKNGQIEINNENIDDWKRNHELLEEMQKLYTEYDDALREWVASGYK